LEQEQVRLSVFSAVWTLCCRHPVKCQMDLNTTTQGGTRPHLRKTIVAASYISECNNPSLSRNALALQKLSSPLQNAEMITDLLLSLDDLVNNAPRAFQTWLHVPEFESCCKTVGRQDSDNVNLSLSTVFLSMASLNIPYLRTPPPCFENLPDFPYQPHYIQYGNLRMACIDERTAKGDEEVYLCLHGQPTWSYLYRRMIPTLLSVTTKDQALLSRRVVIGTRSCISSKHST